MVLCFLKICHRKFWSQNYFATVLTPFFGVKNTCYQNLAIEILVAHLLAIYHQIVKKNFGVKFILPSWKFGIKFKNLKNRINGANFGAINWSHTLI